MKSQKWIFFDLDDTLVHSNRFYSEVLSEMGILANLQWAKARKLVKECLEPIGSASARNRVLYFKKYLELNGGVQAKALLELISCYEKKLCEKISLQWNELGREAFFSELTKTHKLAIVTNETTRMQLLKLEKMDPMGRHFSFMITSEEVGCEKPNPIIFFRALDLAKASPEDVLFVGDSLEKDCLPAIEIGMRALQSVEFEVGDRHSKVEQILKLRDLERYL